jgi:hypothetical protein
MIGSVLRLGEPGIARLPRGLGNPDEFWQQKIIVGAVDSAHTVTVDSGIPGGISNTWTISDPVDLPEYMLDCFLISCEWAMLRKTDPARAGYHEQLCRRELIKAMERDSVVNRPEGVAAWPSFKHPSWAMLTGTLTPS